MFMKKVCSFFLISAILGMTVPAEHSQGATSMSAPYTAVINSNVKINGWYATPVNVHWWGALGDGSDATADIQAALNSGATAVYIPPGDYKVCGLVLPSTLGLHVYGAGTATRILMSSCSSAAIGWSQTDMAWNPQEVSDLLIDGTNGSSNAVDTRGQGDLTLRNLTFHNVPKNSDAIFIGGVNGTKTHDVRVLNPRVYEDEGSAEARAFLELGPLTSDAYIAGMVANGAFSVDYGIVTSSDTETTVFSGNHPYNNLKHVLWEQGCNNCQHIGNTWDNSKQTLAVVRAHNSTYAGDMLEATNSGQDALDLVGASANSFSGTIFGTTGCSSALAVSEDDSSNGNRFNGGSINTLSCWKLPVISLKGANSSSTGIPGINPLGVNFGFSGSTSTVQADGTSVYLGVNGAQSSPLATQYVSPYVGNVKTATVYSTSTPASGTQYAVILYDGTSQIGACNIASGSYSCELILSNTYVAKGDSLYLNTNIPSGAGATYFKYSIVLQG